MHCIIAKDGRFALNQGKPASLSLSYDRFWKRYLDVFDSITVLGRLFPVEDPLSAPVEGPRVSFLPLPAYLGPEQYLLKIRETQQKLKLVLQSKSALIMDHSNTGTLLWQKIRKISRPYGLEVRVDPYDIFAPGAVQHPLRPLFRWWSTSELKWLCVEACAVSYVTKYALQQRYPAAENAFTTYYSNVKLPETALMPIPRPPSPEKNEFTLISIGSMAHMHKGMDVLIDAVAACVQEGLNLKLILVGKGKHQAKLEQQAQKLGLESKVCFLGTLTAGKGIFEQLDRSDLFILPSRAEGLPRAMVEAMARALPCLGSTVSGIPELLAPEDLVPPDDVAALARKIREVLTNPERIACMSARNLKKAKAYTEPILRQRRIAFYSSVREQTEAWFKSQ